MELASVTPAGNRPVAVRFLSTLHGLVLFNLVVLIDLSDYSLILNTGAASKYDKPGDHDDEKDYQLDKRDQVHQAN